MRRNRSTLFADCLLKSYAMLNSRGDFMAINVQELYQQTVRPLPSAERLTLAALILNDISQHEQPSQPKGAGDIRKFFGRWKNGKADGSDNEEIDRDLVRAYAQENEDES